MNYIVSFQDRNIDIKLKKEEKKRKKAEKDIVLGEMAGGGIATNTTKQYEGRVTAFVLVTCIVAAMGGLLFGYDIGISGT